MNSRLGITAAALWFTVAAVGQTKIPFAIQGEQFLLHGKPFRIFSGEIHYPRVPREYWKDRLLKARAMGLNTVCTYLFWNWHEKEPGTFSFEGNLDVASFIRTAQEVGLQVIIRPGPYVCSEWDFGGLPAWLLREPDIRVRCMDPKYLAAAERYVQRIGKELRDLQITRGGPIILLQIENEYGSYANDGEYMLWLRDQFRKAGFDVPFFTSDGGAQYLFEAGNVSGALPVVNFGGDPQGQFTALSNFRTGIPLMCGEYWCGWFTHWGNAQWGSSGIADNARDLEWMLSSGKSFNLYMFHGGTNFGWSAGANWDEGYRADVTSYDYDAPLDEAGRPTEKYHRFRSLLARYQAPGSTLPEPPPGPAFLNLDPIQLKEAVSLFGNLPHPIRSVGVKSMESYGQNYGYILYRTRLWGPRSGKLIIQEPHDVAYVYLDGKFVGRLERRLNQNTLELPLSPSDHPVLDILVEAMGRINFGSRLIDRKGITEWVTLRGITLTGWEVYPLPCEKAFLKGLKFARADSIVAPGFFRGTFAVQKPGDTYLDMSGWKKGVVWVNGQNLGRYWSLGPQQRLYLPGSWLGVGTNEILVFDPDMTRPAPVRSVSLIR
jgi:beta-galactosidase GanA